MDALSGVLDGLFSVLIPLLMFGLAGFSIALAFLATRNSVLTGFQKLELTCFCVIHFICVLGFLRWWQDGSTWSSYGPGYNFVPACVSALVALVCIGIARGAKMVGVPYCGTLFVYFMIFTFAGNMK